MKRKIMIVDDDPDIRYILKDDLEDEYEILSVENGQECISCLESGLKPDLILLDVMMPGISGWEVYDKIKENPNWQNILIVFLTARTDENALKAGKFFGDDYIEKPYELEDLKIRLNKIFQNRGF